MGVVEIQEDQSFAFDVTSGGDEHILLLEGLGAQLIGWQDEFYQMFVDAGYTVVRMDNRDVGGSPRFVGDEYRMSDMAGDADRLLGALGVDSAHIIGQSMGGMIAQELALTFPGRVRSLGLIYSASSAAFLAPSSRVMRSSPPPALRDKESFIEHYVEDERVCWSERYPMDVDWKRRLAGLMWERGWDAEGPDRQLSAIYRSPDRLDRLASIQVPTVLIHGTADALIPPIASEAMAARMPNAELHLIEGMGHSIPRPLWPTIEDALVRNVRRAG